MNPMNPICVLHDQRLTTMMDTVHALSVGQMKLAESLAGMRREMELGFNGVYRRQDATNGRVTALEPKVQRLEVSSAAQDVFTPGLSRDIMQFEQAVQTKLDELRADVRNKSDHIWAAVHTLEDRERTLNDEKQNAKGVATGVSATVRLVWAVLAAACLAGGWGIGLYLARNP